MEKTQPVESNCSVTVVLTLKGRESFNPRWLNYHADVGLNCPVIVGDGAPTPEIENLFKSNSSLDLKYLKFSDKSLRHFYHKLCTLLDSVDTPYVFMSDNDDFIIPSGIRSAVDFLNQNPEYVSYGGGVLGFYLFDTEFGGYALSKGENISGLRFVYPHVHYENSSAQEQISALFSNYIPIWYGVHRTSELRRALHEFYRAETDDIMMFELFVMSMMAIQGKCLQTQSCPTYMRQLNSSQTASSYQGFFRSILEENFAPSVSRCLDLLAKNTAASIGNEEDEALVRERISDLLAEYFAKNAVAAPLRPTLTQWLKPWVHTVRAKLPWVRAPILAIERMLINRRVMQGPTDQAQTKDLNKALNLAFSFVKGDLP